MNYTNCNLETEWQSIVYVCMDCIHGLGMQILSTLDDDPIRQYVVA